MLSRTLAVSALSCFLASPLWAGSAWAYGVSKDSGWIDVNKAWNPYSSSDVAELGDGAYSDNYMCWAAQSSNMLQYWQNAYTSAGNTLSAGTPDGYVAGRENATRRQYQIFDYFVNNWTDNGGNAYYGISWYMTGGFPNDYYPTTDDDWSQRRDDSTGTGGFFTNVYSDADSLYSYSYNGFTSDFRYYHYNESSYVNTYTDYASFSKLLIDSFTEENAVVGIDVTFSVGGGHALTAWGCEYDENGYVTKIYLTDSDDGEVDLMEVGVEGSDSGILLTGYSSSTTQIIAMSSLSVSKYAAAPEPSMFGLFAGFAALAFVGSRRRIRK